MTDKSPNTRFASLEAIPPHKGGPGGLLGLLAALYIRRGRTLSAMAGILACSVAAILFVPAPGTQGSSSAQIPDSPPKADEGAPLAELKLPVEVLSTVENKLPDAPQTTAPAPVVAVAHEAKPEPVVALPKPAEPANAEPRKIIPVSEAMSLYDVRVTAEPPKVEPEAARLPEETKPFFAEGLSSEEETLAFFSGAAVSNPSTADGDGNREEDLSPTLELPASVPSPIAKPVDDARVEFRIVQGDGVQSGFVLFNKEDKNLRRYFVVVQAFRGGGVIPWKFKDIADGKDVSTRKFAVEVTEEAFRGLSEEKRKFGKVVNALLGSAKDDKAAVEWIIDSNGNMLAAPEGRS